MAEAQKETSKEQSSAPATNGDGTLQAVTVAEPAAGSPDAMKAQEEQQKAAQKAEEAAMKASGANADEEPPAVMHMRVVQNAPYTGTVAGATDTVRGGRYMVGGKYVDANGMPLKDQGDKETS
jgi:hypothetical protein